MFKTFKFLHFLKEHAMHIPAPEERRRTVIWGLHKIMEIIYSLAIVRQCNIAYNVVHAQLCLKCFLFVIIFLSCWPG